MTKKILCFGDSITRGLISANYVHLLERRLESKGYTFINAGVNNDLTYNLLQRIDEVIEAQPQAVTILAGTNDVIATLGPENAAFYAAIKRLPRYPTVTWSWRNLTEVIRRIKEGTAASIGLLSIPMLGENPRSYAVGLVREYNQGVQVIAAREKVNYLPLFERHEQALRDDGIVIGRAYYGSTLMTLEFALRRLFGEDYDEFSRRKGFAFTIDGVHFNNRGAALVADEIEKYLSGLLV